MTSMKQDIPIIDCLVFTKGVLYYRKQKRKQEPI